MQNPVHPINACPKNTHLPDEQRRRPLRLEDIDSKGEIPYIGKKKKE